MLAAVLSHIVQPTRIVCIDPGHPSENGIGAVSKGLREMDLVWDVAARATIELQKSQNPHIKVVLTKESLEDAVTNRERAERANRAKADLNVRLHADSGGRSGIATYYPARAAKVAGRFGPSEAVLKRTAELAPKFHDAMAAELHGHLPNLGLMTEAKTRIGAKQGALTGSVFSEVPVVLVELCAVDNPHDAKFARSEEGKNALARAVAAGIRAALAESR